MMSGSACRIAALVRRLAVLLAMVGLLLPTMTHAGPVASLHRDQTAALTHQSDGHAPTHAPASHDRTACAFCAPLAASLHPAVPVVARPVVMRPPQELSGRDPPPEHRPPRSPLVS